MSLALNLCLEDVILVCFEVLEAASLSDNIDYL